MSQTQFRFWISERYGLIRQDASAPWEQPQVWSTQGWIPGSPYVMDSITGLGEDLWSSGDCADECDLETAEAFAQEKGIDLLSPTMK